MQKETYIQFSLGNSILNHVDLNEFAEFIVSQFNKKNNVNYVYDTWGYHYELELFTIFVVHATAMTTATEFKGQLINLCTEAQK